MTDSETVLRAVTLKPDADYLAPDGSQIWLLPTMNGGGICHCPLPAGKSSSRVAHRHVEEIWYVLKVQGEVWRRAGQIEDLVPVSSGISPTIQSRAKETR